MWEATLMVPTTLHTRSCTDTLHHEHQQHKNCDEAHTICDSRNLGFRKDNLAKWKDGSDDVRGKRNKVSWRKAGQMTGQARPGQAGHTHTHTHSHWQRLSRESNIQCMPPFTTPQSHNGKKTNWICFTYFCSVVLIGCRSWAIMLTMWRVYLMHMLLWLGPSCVCVSKQLDMVLFQQLLCCPLCGFETDIIVWMNMK